MKTRLLILNDLPPANPANCESQASLLWGLNRLHADVLGPAGETLYPQSGQFVQISFLIAGCVVFLAFSGVYTLLLDGRENVDHPRIIQDFYMPPVLRNIYRVALVVLLGAAALTTREYAVFPEGSLTEQRAFAVHSDRFVCSDIREVTMSYYYIHGTRGSPGRNSSSRALHVWLKNDSHWSARGYDVAASNERSVRLGQRLAQDCGLTLEYPYSIVDLPKPLEPGESRRRSLEAFAFGAFVVMTLWFLLRDFRTPVSTNRITG
ncbi:MAG: hypothetical protein FJW31_23960 [Acidobacteria bacterium]|nr:hypothetical protein [Acidobacteriota bacterium]